MLMKVPVAAEAGESAPICHSQKELQSSKIIRYSPLKTACHTCSMKDRGLCVDHFSDDTLHRILCFVEI